MSVRLLVIPLLGLAALIAVTALAGSAASPRATQFQRVAADPERYRDREVRVTGLVHARSDRIPAAFTLRGPEGRRLLLVPESGSTIMWVPVGARVSVRGALVPLAADAEDRPHVAAVGDVAARMDAVAVLRAIALSPRALVR